MGSGIGRGPGGAAARLGVVMAAAMVTVSGASAQAGERAPEPVLLAEAVAPRSFDIRPQPLASALAQKKRFPSLLSMFARLGEQTGQLPHMLQRAAMQLSAEVQRRSLQLATLLEPLLIVGMGMVVMLIVLAVLLPIIQLNQLVR